MASPDSLGPELEQHTQITRKAQLNWGLVLQHVKHTFYVNDPII